MNAQPNGNTRGGLRLVVDNSDTRKSGCPTAEKLRRRQEDVLHSNVRAPSTAANYAVRLARTTESTEMADLLVDAYHRERLSTPFRSVQRVALGQALNRETLALAVEELEGRGWSVESGDFDVDIASATALWLRPYA